MAVTVRQNVVEAKRLLQEGREKAKSRHAEGLPSVLACAQITDMLETIVLDTYEAALADMHEADAKHLARNVTLVAHGGFGRRDVAAYSDIDLMVLHTPAVANEVVAIAKKLVTDIYDAGLVYGNSTRTPAQACQLAMGDSSIFTSLAESRLLAGSVRLFSRFMQSFRRQTRRRRGRLVAEIEKSRRDERRQYGETIYLLEPNVKRSRGGLRDLQMLRWVGFARYGECEPDALYRMGVLTERDFKAVTDARDFLLRLRNELQFQANSAQDLLERHEQVRIAELWGYQGAEGVLPVEQFMRDYFHHTSEIRNVSTNLTAGARQRTIMASVVSPIVSHQVERDFRVGLTHISATTRGMQRIDDLAHVLRLMELSNFHDKRIDHDTWDAIRTAMMAGDNVDLSEVAITRFLSLMSQPARLGPLLRRLHELGALEKLVPAMKHARCLLQFNSFHKFTVDAHCLRAVECATDFISDETPLGDAYRAIKNKRTVHLALLLHDLGKGYTEDHSEVGLRLADETARRLMLPQAEAEAIKFLVHKHLMMTELAFHRDINDDAAVIQFAEDVGSPELLQMLFVHSCADLAAVGPGVLNDWKRNVISHLYLRTMRHLVGGSATIDAKETSFKCRREAKELVRQEKYADWFTKQIDALPPMYLDMATPEQVISDLTQVHQLDPQGAVAWGRYVEEQGAVEYTVGTYEHAPLGIFHKLTGALTAKGCQILSAEINTLADALVLDRFHVQDLDFAGEPPDHRIAEISRALTAALENSGDKAPKFRKVWQAASDKKPMQTHRVRVRIDNSTSERYTIIDVFATDRLGLLYSIARALNDLDISVFVAKISTYYDRVVDVFYVTGANGQKIKDAHRLELIRHRLTEAIETPAAE